MPGIKSVQKIQIPTRYAKDEIKGRDFYTHSGKSDRMSLQSAKNVSHQPSSFKYRPDGQQRSTFLAAALGVGAMATLSQTEAATQIKANVLNPCSSNKSLATSNNSALYHPPISFNPLPKNHSYHNNKLLRAEGLPAKPAFSNRQNLSYHLPQSSLSRQAENLSNLRTLENNPPLDKTRHADYVKKSPFKTTANKSIERHRTKRQQIDRDAKAHRNEGDEQYWLPVSDLPTTDLIAPIALTTPSIDHQNYPKKNQWHKPLREVISYLQDSSQIAYPSLATTRLDAARLAYRMTQVAVWPDEDIFHFANQQLDPANANYSLPMSRELNRYEALLYYVQYRAVDWELNLSDSHFERAFFGAHELHQQVFNAETVVKFYLEQFHKLQRQPAEPFKTRNELGSLEKYYAQFNDYLKLHASDDAANIAMQMAVFREISQLDLERAFKPLFSLRVGHYQRKLLPHTAFSIKTPKFGAFIYILQGYSGKYYAASMWGPILMMADLGDILNAEKADAINIIKNNGIVSPESLDVKTLFSALWPENRNFSADKRLVIIKFEHQIVLTTSQPLLRDAFIHLQRKAIKEFVDAWRKGNLNRSSLEKLLSFLPFFDVIQRRVYDPLYHPTMKDLAFDLFDLSLTLLTLGIPLVKLGTAGLKTALITMKTARLAGLTGSALRNAVLEAIGPILKKMAKVSGREIAGFIFPPYQLLRLLRKPVKTRFREIVKPNKGKVLKRCVRAIGGACAARTESLQGFDIVDWDNLITHLLTDTASWRGTTIPRAYRHNYIRQFTALSHEQKEALRGWSYVPKQKEYRNYPRKRSWPAGKSNINFMLNKALIDGHPGASMLKTAHHLSSALRALPRMPDSQSLVRVVDILEDNASLFRAGDVVSNYPAFMSASSKGKLANIALSQGWMFDPTWKARANAAIAIYHITADKSKPLINRLATQIDMEGEYLFDQRSVFKIEAITRLFMTSSVRSFKQVYFIKLVEISADGPHVVKNIFTAKDILI